ncbi:hypothetical protein NGRA_1526 [Nosema granulosis]|uniref:Uncharacterized protein n=1 Tax=Nosema granulosis TaxID=83296 RepID=A0A9P6KYJ0_9MICR|nr:hypothetical protein NGRA_1526 [Nosema granulosis]
MTKGIKNMHKEESIVPRKDATANGEEQFLIQKKIFNQVSIYKIFKTIEKYVGDDPEDILGFINKAYQHVADLEVNFWYNVRQLPTNTPSFQNYISKKMNDCDVFDPFGSFYEKFYSHLKTSLKNFFDQPELEYEDNEPEGDIHADYKVDEEMIPNYADDTKKFDRKEYLKIPEEARAFLETYKYYLPNNIYEAYLTFLRDIKGLLISGKVYLNDGCHDQEAVRTLFKKYFNNYFSNRLTKTVRDLYPKSLLGKGIKREVKAIIHSKQNLTIGTAKCWSYIPTTETMSWCNHHITTTHLLELDRIPTTSKTITTPQHSSSISLVPLFSLPSLLLLYCCFFGFYKFCKIFW